MRRINAPKSCFQCGGSGANLHGYVVCDSCRSKLGLLTDETIKKHLALYKSSKSHSYQEETKRRLDFIEKDYIKKKIKLFHINDRLNHL